MKNNRIKGISLIVLIVTIIVIVILAGTVILSLAENNTIETANEAVFKNDLSTMQEQLSSYLTTQLSETSGTFDVNTVTGNLSAFIPGATNYEEDFEVVQGNLVYNGDDENKIDISLEMGAVIPEIVTVSGLTFNKPDLAYLPEATTKAVKWDANNVESEIDLAVAKNDTSWYDYSAKKYANIKTINNGNVAYWVWIPRFASKYMADQEVIYNVKFLAGTTNTVVDGSAIPEGYEVDEAFTFGDTQLTGIWVAKYEASSTTPNALETSVGYTGGANTTALHVRVLPSVYSWRNISTGNAQTVSMNMTSSTGSVGTTLNLDTHLIKGGEWGAAWTLSRTIYGNIPWINPYGDSVAGSRKCKTGYSGESEVSVALAEGNAGLHPYNDLVYGGKSSTTGNIYGVYDMMGGSWDANATFINKGNSNISTYGKAEHFLNNQVRPEFAKYYYVDNSVYWTITSQPWNAPGGGFIDYDCTRCWVSIGYSGNKLTVVSFRPTLVCGLGL